VGGSEGLVVEDFEVLARSLGTGLRREGMAVDVALDGTAALDRLAVIRYDVVILSVAVASVRWSRESRSAPR
jgi:DNA-binding response OmpR family regulator